VTKNRAAQPKECWCGHKDKRDARSCVWCGCHHHRPSAVCRDCGQFGPGSPNPPERNPR
jgi:hypothetical protein